MTEKRTDYEVDNTTPVLTSLKHLIAQAESAGDNGELINQLKRLIAETENTQTGDRLARFTEAVEVYAAEAERERLIRHVVEGHRAAKGRRTTTGEEISDGEASDPSCSRPGT